MTGPFSVGSARRARGAAFAGIFLLSAWSCRARSVHVAHFGGGGGSCSGTSHSCFLAMGQQGAAGISAGPSHESSAGFVYALGWGHPVVLVIDGYPAPYGVSSPHAYGTNIFHGPTAVSVCVDAVIDDGRGSRRLSRGWAGSGCVPPSGTNNRVSVYLDRRSELTWLWASEYLLGLTATNGVIGGASAGWQQEGWVFDLVATNDYGYVFDRWVLNETDAGSNSVLRVVMDGPKTVEALFILNFMDVTGNIDVSLVDWRVNRQTGTVLASVLLLNRPDSGKRLVEKFWYAAFPTPTIRLMHPDGRTPDGKDYVDITAKVEALLPHVGNGDLALDPGESVTVPDIEFYVFDRSEPVGFAYAVWADPPHEPRPFTGLRDTDGDGIPNEWELAHALNMNDPGDARQDFDGDQATNLDEYVADTDPHDRHSRFRVVDLHRRDGVLVLQWGGGDSVTQYVQAARSIHGPWVTVHTNSVGPLRCDRFAIRDSVLSRYGFFRLRSVR